MSMKQLTLRGMSRDIEKRIREVAKKEGVSLNKAALRLLQRGTQTSTSEVAAEEKIGHSLDKFFGIMSKEEADAIMETNKVFDVIDQELWK